MDEVARLILYCDHGQNATRTIDVQTRTDLDTVARSLRAIAGWTGDTGQYRMATSGKLYGNPPGRSQPHVTRGKSTPIARMLKTDGGFTFRSSLKTKLEHRVVLLRHHMRIWRASDYPMLIDIRGEMNLHREPDRWDILTAKINSAENQRNLDERGLRRTDQLVRSIDIELMAIRGPRRGPLESHEPGTRRGWRERIENPPPAETQAAEVIAHRAADRARHDFMNTGTGYAAERDITDHYKRSTRPCLVEQVALRRAGWCTRGNCPGCREDRGSASLLRDSEVWYTHIGEERITARLSHTRLDAAAAAEDLAALIKLVNAAAIETEPDGTRKIAGWIAPPGDSWIDMTDRYRFTPVLLQPAEAPGPASWTRISPWPA